MNLASFHSNDWNFETVQKVCLIFGLHSIYVSTGNLLFIPWINVLVTSRFLLNLIC